jgi:FkbM family methyltransferase
MLLHVLKSLFAGKKTPEAAPPVDAPPIPLHLDVRPFQAQPAPAPVTPAKEMTLEEYAALSPRCELSFEGVQVVYTTPNVRTRWRVETLFDKEPITIQWISGFRENEVLVDIGANVGMYTIFAAKVRGVRVFAFEPEAQNYALLNRNILLNELSGSVSAYCLAMSDRAEVSALHLASTDTGASGHSFGEMVGSNHEPVTPVYSQGCVASTLDELVAQGVLPCPDYIKIDVDGFEPKVIAGAMQCLRSGSVRSLLIEVNPALEDHRDMTSLLNSMGYRHDPAQVAAATRESGPFAGVAETLFIKS